MIKFRQLNGKTVIEFVDRAELLKLIGKRKLEPHKHKKEPYPYEHRVRFRNDAAVPALLPAWVRR